MQGYLLTFFTQQDQRHGHQPLHEWLVAQARGLGVQGATTLAATEGVGRHGRVHSAHFFELADQPVEVQMAVTEAQRAALFGLLKAEQLSLFYLKTPVEFGRTDDAAG